MNREKWARVDLWLIPSKKSGSRGEDVSASGGDNSPADAVRRVDQGGRPFYTTGRQVVRARHNSGSVDRPPAIKDTR